MDHSYDGSGISREQLEAKAEAAALAGQLDGDSSQQEAAHSGASRPNSACDWRGDPPDPELDDLAHPPAQSQSSSRPANACDWRGDGPEPHEDDLASVCPPNNQDQQPGRRNQEVEETRPTRMPVSRSSKLTDISETLSSPADNETAGQGRNNQSSSESPARGGIRPDHGRARQPEVREASIAGPSGTSPRDRGTTNESPVEGKTHSPWVDSLEHMPASMMEKVNLGLQQAKEAATNILTPAAQKQTSPEAGAAPKGRKTSSLAPESAGPPPDFYLARPAPAVAKDSAGDHAPGSDKQHERERRKSEKKARREARRRSRQEKRMERKEKRKDEKERRRDEKEMRQKEREWKKAAKQGEELPAHLLRGLRTDAADLHVPYNPKCDICTASAAAAMNSHKHNPRCTICAQAARRQSTTQYLNSSKINTAEASTLDQLVDVIKTYLGRENPTAGEASAGDHVHIDEDLAHHIALHVQDLANNGGEACLRGHKCNKKGQPGHLARHGLDGNRDSPPTTEGGQIVSVPSQIPNTSSRSMPTEVDWWVRALSQKESPSSLCRPNSPPRAGTPLQRSKTAMYDSRSGSYSTPNRMTVSQAAYHFYLPFPACHNFCYSPGRSGSYSGFDRYPIPPFPPSPHAISPGYYLNRDVALPSPSRAETLSSGVQSVQDGIYHRRSRSGSI
ncbi:hypothetical protein F4777DRAFT_153393 [Nemania sp. FL0916]|nr:hypothetical protein F4777DRAFT_153393 [Nemania sp. FL0916]